MKTLPSCLCILGLAAGTATGQTVDLLDQVGLNNGSSIIFEGAFANQYFASPANSAYNIGAIEDFENPNGLQVAEVIIVSSGFTQSAYTGIDAISAYQVNFYNSNTSGGVSLVGDVASENYTGPFVGDPNWELASSELLSFTPAGGFWTVQAGTNYVSAIPTNDFATNGQTSVAQSNTGNDLFWQANPLGGFGFGSIQQVVGNFAIRVIGGSGNPCDLPLPVTCRADVSGPQGEPDGIVGVDDILSVIGTFGQAGDGSSRPQGDCAPLPAGNCLVDVDDLLAAIGEFGTDCRPRGACCAGVDGCNESIVEEDCDDNWLGQGSTCGECLIGACCTPDASDCVVSTPADCIAAGNIYRGDFTVCTGAEAITCEPVPSNNDCSGAIALTQNANGTVDVGIALTYATTTGPENANCEGFPRQLNNDIWYTFTASLTGELLVSTCQQVDFDSVIEVWNGCPGNAGATVLACNDDGPGACAADFTSELTTPILSGDVVYIRVGAFEDIYGVLNGSTGILTVTERLIDEQGCCVDEDCFDLLPDDCVLFGGTSQGFGTACNDGETQCGTPNNFCDSATVVACDGAYPFDTTFAADSGFGVPDDTQCTGTYLDWGTTNPDCWFKFTPATDGTVTVSLCDANSFDTSLVLYSGADCNSLTQIACNGDATVETGCQSFYSGIYDLPVTGGADIYVRIGGWQGATGTGTVTISCTGADATGACCLPDSSCLNGQTAAECAANQGQWNNGVICADIECPDDVRCQNGEIGTGPMGPNEPWTAALSNLQGGVPSTASPIRAQVVNAPSASAVRVAGIQALNAGGFTTCAAGTQLSLTINLLAADFSTALSVGNDTFTETNLTYNGLFPLYVYGASGLNQNAPFSYVSAYSSNNFSSGECVFLWKSSNTDGTLTSFIDQGAGFVEQTPGAGTAYALNACVTQ